MVPANTTALILSGGGARGAYEVGVVAGITEALAHARPTRGPFEVFTGTSVGAVNATYLAAHAHLPDLAIDGLVTQWRELTLDRHLPLDPFGMLGWPRTLPIRLRLRRAKLDAQHLGAHYGRALFDPRPLERLVATGLSWEQLHANVRDGTVRALIIAALDVARGRTTVFGELADGVAHTSSRDPRREFRPERITEDHVLASAAIPMVFPARRIGNAYYCDGGLRFNTPMAPALRLGVDRLVLIALRYAGPPAHRTDALPEYPSPLFLVGKVLNALLLDPVDYDLQVLERLNRLLAALEETVSPAQLAGILRVLEEERGMPYRRVSTLVFRPSEDIGVIAGRFLRRARGRGPRSLLTSLLLRRAAAIGHSVETDLGSFLLFDGEFAAELIALGRRDALSRADEIRAFFAPSLRATPRP